MRSINSLSWLSVLASLTTSIPAINAQNSSVGQWPVHDNGLNDVVQWDHYSFKVNGKRLFVFSGEIHYWRIPVPEIWEDLLEKIKAAGFTAFAFYGNWGYHSANNQTVDFDSPAHDFTKLYDIAERVGLYVITRPGPYVNAEANAGGFPLWLTTGAYGKLRDDDPRYLAALEPFFSGFAKRAAERGVTKGGNGLVFQLENEYGQQWKNRDQKIPDLPSSRYMEHLQKLARANNIDVPVIHNDPNMNTKSWSEDYAPGALGNVDIAGLDSYPSCWSCNLDECTGTNGEYVAYQTINYYDYFAQTSPTQPSFFPEFQGGSYNPWGGPEGGCPGDIGADFANLFYRNLIAQRSTALSLYMMFGGTNWGALACPVVATSYDYSSPISENRRIDSKFYETKNLAMFTRIAEDLTVTDRIGNSTSYSTNSAIKASELRNPETKSAFYVTVHDYSPSGTREEFKLHISTSIGNLTVPQTGNIVLNGHQSKILVTDFAFGDHTITYSTAEVLTYSIVDGKPVLVLWTGAGESAEFHIKGAKKGSAAQNGKSSNATIKADSHGVLVNVPAVSGQSVYEFDKEVRVIVVDKPTAYLYWAPNLSKDPFAPVDQSIIVGGPYLVRHVEEQNGVLALKGDIMKSTEIEVFASKDFKRLSWNGQELKTHRTAHGSLTANVKAFSGKIELPELKDWKVANNLPEKELNYDDSGAAWVEADHVTTTNPTKPDTLPVLYVDEYGFHNSFHLFRGYFNGPATGVKLALQGGLAFGWTAWLNGEFIGSWYGNSTLGQGNQTLSFNNATLNANGTNVLVVAQDNSGHDLRGGATDPRGILAASLVGGSGNFTKWKIAGEAGGDKIQLDPVRGPLAEGGLSNERLGWHLPGFDDSKWETGSPSTGFSGATIKFYRTVVPLDVPENVDASFAFVLNAPASKQVRVHLFVNGYQYGRFNPWVGNEVKFPVPAGVLNYGGDNVIGLSVWSQSNDGAKIEVKIVQEYAIESSWKSRFDGEYLRPGWTEKRLAYA